jgi:DNA-binding PucR family transcriptional regulator
VWGLASGGRCVLFVADDHESEGWLDRTADALNLERPLVVSAASNLDRAGSAAARALALSDLVRADRSQRSRRVVRCEGHEVEVLLALDQELSQSIADRVLAPVAGLASPRRERMLDTLDAWLANPGRPRALAAQLHLHVQGVRYRLAQLRDLFGDALDDPQRRFELALALRVHRSRSDGPVP